MSMFHERFNPVDAAGFHFAPDAGSSGGVESADMQERTRILAGFTVLSKDLILKIFRKEEFLDPDDEEAQQSFEMYFEQHASLFDERFYGKLDEAIQLLRQGNPSQAVDYIYNQSILFVRVFFTHYFQDALSSPVSQVAAIVQGRQLVAEATEHGSKCCEHIADDLLTQIDVAIRTDPSKNLAQHLDAIVASETQALINSLTQMGEPPDESSQKDMHDDMKRMISALVLNAYGDPTDLQVQQASAYLSATLGELAEAGEQTNQFAQALARQIQAEDFEAAAAERITMINQAVHDYCLDNLESLRSKVLKLACNR